MAKLSAVEEHSKMQVETSRKIASIHILETQLDPQPHTTKVLNESGSLALHVEKQKIR